MTSSFRCSTAFFGTLTAILYYRYIIVPLILFLRIVDAVTCPSESSGSGAAGSSSSSTGLNKPTAITKRKVCPDFKDNEDEKYCCPSHIIPGSYYCCSQEHLYKIEAEQAAEIRRQFIKNAVIPIPVSYLLFFHFLSIWLIMEKLLSKMLLGLLVLAYTDAAAAAFGDDDGANLA
uniref:Uncharacterized protein n=1 Tax=Setaria digitata TaxID=48799 RepID=A0A915PI79_9BILA